MKLIGLWTPERDAMLLQLADEAVNAKEIARRIADMDTIMTPKAVLKRLDQLGVRIRKKGSYWTWANEARLRALWTQEPRLSLKQIVDAFNGDVDVQAVSRRAGLIGLPSRYSTVEVRHEQERQAAPAIVEGPDDSDVACNPAELSRQPAPRPAPPRFTPCPYYDPREKPGACGEMVDRTPHENGERGSAYCARHLAIVAVPLSRGTIGTVSRRDCA
jgi:hypothetical protein